VQITSASDFAKINDPVAVISAAKSSKQWTLGRQAEEFPQNIVQLD